MLRPSIPAQGLSDVLLICTWGTLASVMKQRLEKNSGVFVTEIWPSWARSPFPKSFICRNIDQKGTSFFLLTTEIVWLRYNYPFPKMATYT